MVEIFCILFFISSIVVLVIAILFLREAKENLRKFNEVKNYEILVHGDDMFLIPNEKLKQLYFTHIDRR